jgi:hypothetical protein
LFLPASPITKLIIALTRIDVSLLQGATRRCFRITSRPFRKMFRAFAGAMNRPVRGCLGGSLHAGMSRPMRGTLHCGVNRPMHGSVSRRPGRSVGRSRRRGMFQHHFKQLRWRGPRPAQHKNKR